MVRPSLRRTVVSYLGTAYPISQRRACRTVPCARAPDRYHGHRDPRTALRATDPGARSDPRALWLPKDKPHELLDDHNLYLTVAARHGQADILWMAVKDHIDSGVSYGDVPQLDLF